MHMKPVILFQHVSHDIQEYRDDTTSLDGVQYVLVTITMHPPQYYCRKNRVTCEPVDAARSSNPNAAGRQFGLFVPHRLTQPCEASKALSKIDTCYTLVARMAAAERNWWIVPNARKNFEASRSQILIWFVGFDLAVFKVLNLPKAETPTEVSSSSD